MSYCVYKVIGTCRSYVSLIHRKLKIQGVVSLEYVINMRDNSHIFIHMAQMCFFFPNALLGIM